MENVFMVPKKIVYGTGSISTLGKHIQGRGTKALIVTGPIVARLGSVAKITHTLTASGIDYAVYLCPSTEPTDTVVTAGLTMYKKQKCDFLIALGGGSPLDTAKAIALLAVYGGRLSDYMHTIIDRPVPFLVAIPTTAGTGSEATKNTIIADTTQHIKMLLGGPSLIPALAVIDPDLTMTAPPSVTAATGIDALTHAIEAYTSRKAQPLTDQFALPAIAKIYQNLPVCCRDGKNAKARLQLALASLEAGIAFTNASVTLVHGMSRPIGALFHIAHGVSNAILLPACLEFAIQKNTARFAVIARTMGIAGSNVPDTAAAQVLPAAVARLCKNVGIPTLAELGVKKETFLAQLDKMAADALESGSPQNTMRIPDKEDMIHIYKKLF